MNILTLLLQCQSQPTLTLRAPPSKQLALREIPSTAKPACKNIRRAPNQTNSPKHSPVIYLKALVPIQLPWRLASTHAPPPQTKECQYHGKLPRILPDTYQKWHCQLERQLNEAAGNAYLTASYVPVKFKCIIIMKYRTGTLYNQKHAAWFKHSISLTCPLCPQLDSALHVLSRC